MDRRRRMGALSMLPYALWSAVSGTQKRGQHADDDQALARS
jgi:hypothetical protein